MNKRNQNNFLKFQWLNTIGISFVLFLFIFTAMYCKRKFIDAASTPVFFSNKNIVPPPTSHGVLRVSEKDYKIIKNSDSFIYSNKDNSLWIFSVQEGSLENNIRDFITNKILLGPFHFRDIEIFTNNDSMIYQYHNYLTRLKNPHNNKLTIKESLLKKIEFNKSFDQLCFLNKCHNDFLAISLKGSPKRRI